jgi:hypothetical protein
MSTACVKHGHKLSSGIWNACCLAKICQQNQAFPPFSFSKFQVFSEKKGEKVRSRKERALGQDNPLKHNWPSNQPLWQNLQTMRAATVNQQPPAHCPLDAHYYSVMDEPQTEFIFGFTMVTNSVGNRSHV